jgi:protein-disulfide isomerase
MKKLVIVSIVVLVAIFFGGGYLYKNAQTEKSVALLKEQALLFERPYSFTLGKKDAKVQLVEFLDPACATCAAFHPHIKDIIKKYDGEVRLVLRYAPFHKNSNYAVKMLAGAQEQEKFMEVLDLMFSTQNVWIEHHVVNPNSLWKLLFQIEGLDMNKLSTYMNGTKGDEIVKQDLADAQTLGVNKTPGYIVNGKPLQEFGLPSLIDLIESEL